MRPHAVIDRERMPDAPLARPTSSAPRLRILHLLEPADVGGLERVVEGLATGQRRRGHDVVVAAIVHGRAPKALLDRLAAAGVAAQRIEVPERAYRRERRLVRELCAALRPDVAHLHGLRVDILHGGVVRSAGIPTVSTAHGRTGGSVKWRLFERAHDVALSRAGRTIAVSRALADSLVARGVPRERVVLVPNAWVPAAAPIPRGDASRELGLEPGAFHVAWIGRLSVEKGCDTLLRALAEPGVAGIVAHIVGDGPERERLGALAARLGITGAVRWHGLVPDAARRLGAFDALVLSSRTEGTPMVLLEAMAAGTPVVATAVGGVPDMIDDRDALLVAPDDPPAIARALRAVRDDPASAAVRAMSARDRIERQFRAEAWLAAHDRVYASLLAPRQLPSL
jgi:glycosyltransferase involved in cell wall biosynthesis